ncbi:unnamed protein product [Vicia faba]|uniref:Transmembrane protein n=1 Tax=Vicia faba TaxID=3906 RepID=A0AAV1B670_VICFA|nr:unnamed protein product [Vicia faba]
MESFSFNLQAEKTNAILKHRKLQRVTTLLRLVEVCVVLVLISRLSMKLPVAGLGKNVHEETEQGDIYEKFVRKREEKERIRKNDCITVEEGDNRVVEEVEKVKRGVKKGYCYRRCESEVLKKRRRVLRRCESEKKERKSIEGEEEMVMRISYPEDEMSNEEFRRTVEAFIAKQQRIRRGEDKDYSYLV